jgi:hypothetical protein
VQHHPRLPACATVTPALNCRYYAVRVLQPDLLGGSTGGNTPAGQQSHGCLPHNSKRGRQAGSAGTVPVQNNTLATTQMFSLNMQCSDTGNSTWNQQQMKYHIVLLLPRMPCKAALVTNQSKDCTK